MDLDPGSSEEIRRQLEREALVKSHRAAVVTLVGERHQRRKEKEEELVNGGNNSGHAVGVETTLLEAHLRFLATSSSLLVGGRDLSSRAVEMARSYVRAAFSSDSGALPPPHSAAVGGPSSSSPPLARVRAHPRLALRLLAPSVSYPSNYVARGQRRADVLEAAAECLLAEATASERERSLSHERIAGMRERASEILGDACFSDFDLAVVSGWPSEGCDLTTVFEVLAAGPADGVVAATSEDADVAMAVMLSRLLPPPDSASEPPYVRNDGTVRDDVLRMCSTSSVRDLFLPWAAKSLAAVGDPYLGGEEAVEYFLRHLPDDEPYAQAEEEAVPPGRVRLELLARTLLRSSDLTHRLAVLERHVGPSAAASAAAGVPGSDADRRARASAASQARVLVSAIGDVVSTMRTYLPRRMYEERMPEYAALWSLSFRHAAWGRRWVDARVAALSNPLAERRIANFRRLVLGMADAGAFGTFLEKIMTVVCGGGSGDYVAEEGSTAAGTDAMDVDEEGTPQGGQPVRTPREIQVEPSEKVDFYELAAETLAEAADGHSRGGIGGVGVADYRGCLYALHASRGNWRRAAQAMDYYGLAAFAAAGSEGGIEAGTKASRASSGAVSADRVIMDISLSHLGASHAIQLEPKPSNRFIVSGELGPYPVPPFFRDLSASPGQGRNSTKRIREGEHGSAVAGDRTGLGADSSTADDEDRSIRLMTETDLKFRAVKSMALRTLHMDAMEPKAVMDLLRLSDRDVITCLSQLGYYHHAVSMTENMARRRKGRRPMGRDVLSDAVSYVGCKFLSPAAVSLSRPDPRGDAGMLPPLRPTLTQLRQATESVFSASMGGHIIPPTSNSFGCETWRSSGLSESSSRGAIAMELLRRYTTCYAKADNSLALEVAGVLLDLDGGRAELPPWMTDLLMGQNSGLTTARGNQPSGLFANVPSIGTGGSCVGDPSGLVRLYMRRGMYVKACETVVSALSAETEGSAVAPSRLPERGNIDFVPYNVIDMLWDVIQAAVSSPRFGNDERKNLTAARSKMEQAMERHFQLMKVSEMGLKSARALKNT